MSHTDKDMPYWATCEYWRPFHWRCENATEGWYARIHDRDCDLPPTPTRQHPSHWRGWHRRTGVGCSWEPDWETEPIWWSRAWHRAPRRWFIEHVWHNPERRRIRDELRAAAAEWHATGDVENDPANFQARHCAAWLWD